MTAPPTPLLATPLGHPRTHSSGADVLRGIAILLVIVYHAVGAGHGYWLPWHGNTRDFAALSPGKIAWYYPATFGWAGVALFFVLSGFCIHFSFLRAGKPFDARRFFWRRVWRIYPAYLAALVVFLALDRTDVLTRPGAFQLLTHLLFLHNVSHTAFFGVNGAFWSIAVEMQLYLLYPLLLRGRARFGLGRCLAGTCALGLAWRAVAVWRWGVPDHIITPVLTLPLMTWFDWTLGALVAERFHAGRPLFAHRWVWTILLLGAFVASTLYRPLTVFSFSLAAAASAALLDGALQIDWGRRAWVLALEFIGLISYSLYLWHQPAIDPALARLTPLLGSAAAAWTIYGALLIVGSWLSYRWLENPASGREMRCGSDCGRDTTRNRGHDLPDPPAMPLQPAETRAGATRSFQYRTAGFVCGGVLRRVPGVPVCRLLWAGLRRASGLARVVRRCVWTRVFRSADRAQARRWQRTPPGVGIAVCSRMQAAEIIRRLTEVWKKQTLLYWQPAARLVKLGNHENLPGLTQQNFFPLTPKEYRRSSGFQNWVRKTGEMQISNL